VDARGGFAIRPAWAVSGFVFPAAAAFRFFYAADFFTPGAGSSDLRQYFSFVPYMFIAALPALIAPPAGKAPAVVTRWLFSLFSCCVFMAPCAAVPAAVSFFGDTDVPAAAAALASLALFAAAVSALCVFLSLVVKNRALSFVIASAAIAASARFRFDSAAKGIIDTREAVFFAALSWLFLALAVSVEKHGRHLPRSLWLQAAVIAAALVLSGKFHWTADASAGKRFSVSAYSAGIIKKLDSPLAITYYASQGEKNPLADGIFDYLRAYAAKSPLISVKKTGAGTEGAQFVSDILLEYRGKTESVPFAFSLDALEYELDRRVLNLLGSRPLVYAVAGNGLSAETDYSRSLAFLEAAGFMPLALSPESLAAAQDDVLSPAGLRHPLVLFGSSALTREQAGIIGQFMTRGGKIFCAVSSAGISLFSDWSASSVEHDEFLPALKTIGIEVGGGMILDDSCFRLALAEGGADSAGGVEYVNYPFWVSLLPRFAPRHPLSENADGLYLFWASPLALSEAENGSRPRELLVTSPSSWLLPREEIAPSVTNPFFLPDAGARAARGSFVAGAVTENAVVVASQYFAADAMIGYTMSPGNLDFLVNAALCLRGENELLSLRKKFVNTSLYKKSPDGLMAAEKPALAATGIAAPMLAPVIALIAGIKHKRRKR
jgi:ABC-type uncharacterized transport system involved in gliding motility auxiliary subunit